jgi:phosphatidylserine decarboxylase
MNIPSWNLYAPVAQEGLKYIGLGLGLWVLSLIFSDSWLLQMGALGLTGCVIFFFRNPERLTPLDPEAIVSPADGTVMKVEKAPGQDQTHIAIFLSVMNVHINRSPIRGTVKKILYKPGQFNLAFKPKESEENERNTVVIQDEKLREVTVIQIAGFLARRIVCYLKEQDFVASGARFGLIQFGSRTDVIIDSPVEVQVQVGDKVKGGQTVLARFRN